MHAAGMWTAFSAVADRADRRALRRPGPSSIRRTVLETAEREKVGLMTMVGDAYAAPLVEELGRGTYDLSSLFAIGTGGAATNPKHQAALLEYLPQITIINGYGSSETGNMGFGHNQRGDARRTPSICATGGLVLSEDYTRFLEPGDAEVGWVARTGRIPLGYFDDAEPPARPSPWSTGSGWWSPVTARRSMPMARCGCSAATRWWSTPAARRCSSRRSRRCCARTPASPTPWWSAGTASGGVRRSSRWSRCTPAPTVAVTSAARALHGAAGPLQGAQGVHLRRAGPSARQRQGRLPLGEGPGRDSSRWPVTVMT